MPLTIPSIALSATGSNQSYTFSGDWISAHIFNYGTGDVQIDFDTAVSANSTYIPASTWIDIAVGIKPQTGRNFTKPLTLNYKAVTGTATIYLSYITQ